MPFRVVLCALLVVCLVPSSARIRAAEPDQVAADTELLRSAGVATDGPGLIEYFRKRVVNDHDREQVAKLIRDLSNEDFDVREKATAALTTIGAPARPQLQDALKDPDVEVWRRAGICLEQIDKTASPPFLSAAARLLAHHKPEGAAEVLLAFLPSAEDQSVADDVVNTLKVVAFKEGKPLPALLKALEDKDVLRRGGAAEALWRGGDAEQRKVAHKLLDDPDSHVRLRLALAMFDTKDKECVPALIKLLADIPREKAWRVEDVLYRIAGDQGPQGNLNGDAAARQKYCEQWDAWWKEHGKNVDLAKLDDARRLLGYTLLTQMDLTNATGRVTETDQTGKVRWQIEGLRYPVDAQVLRGGDKILVCEYTGRTVTERNLKGEVLWTKAVAGILLSARRLPNGNTFIALRTQLLEVDHDGKEVRAINRNDIVAAVKLRNGDIGIVTTLGKYVRLDTTGKELKSFAVGQMMTIAGHFEVLPNGHVLVPQYTAGRVVEFDADGKEVWTANIQQPTCVTRLPNGNTLVASRLQRYVVELDRTGKEVSRTVAEGRPTSIERR